MLDRLSLYLWSKYALCQSQACFEAIFQGTAGDFIVFSEPCLLNDTNLKPRCLATTDCLYIPGEHALTMSPLSRYLLKVLIMAEENVPRWSKLLLQWTVYTYAAFMLLTSLRPQMEKLMQQQPKASIGASSSSSIATKDVFDWSSVRAFPPSSKFFLTVLDYPKETPGIPPMLRWSSMCTSRCTYGLECNT